MYNRNLNLPLEGISSIFLFGPRGTGKTAFLKANIKDSIYLDLLDFTTYSTLAANPSRLETFIPPNYQEWVIIDEVQKIPALLNEVHRLIESRKTKFILTGSSARKLRKGDVNLLAGRALTYKMHPLIAQELGEDFNLSTAMQFGLLPAAVTHSDPKKYLESYTQTYIQEEIIQEGLTRNIGAFTRFLEVASFSQGEVLNTSEIARELGLNRLVVANYFEILEDLLLSIRISPFTQRAKRKVIAHQKFYFFDVGVFKALRPNGPLDTVSESDGAGLETLFLQSLRAVNDYHELDYDIHFWRTQTGQEVDFVIYGPNGLHAFEIKRSAQVTSTSLKGLKAFGKDYPEAKLYLLHLGKQREYHGPIQAIPLHEALLKLPEIIGTFTK